MLNSLRAVKLSVSSKGPFCSMMPLRLNISPFFASIDSRYSVSVVFQGLVSKTKHANICDKVVLC